MPLCTPAQQTKVCRFVLFKLAYPSRQLQPREMFELTNIVDIAFFEAQSIFLHPRHLKELIDND